MSLNVDLVFDVCEVIIWAGFIFWLAGGACWVEAKVESIKIDNELKRATLKDKTSKDDKGVPHEPQGQDEKHGV